MMAVCVCTFTRRPSEPELQRHLAWLRDLTADGTLVAAGPDKPRGGGVLVVRSDDAEELLTHDPLVVDGIAGYVVTEFTAAIGELAV